jgi:ubiquinone biosynthesis UbiH/UbiF/VisC/COQ6 family hydroxylase
LLYSLRFEHFHIGNAQAEQHQGAFVMDYDLIIVGAGPAGLNFARALAESGLKIALLERQAKAVLAEPAPDGREIALTHLSRAILDELEVWPHIRAKEISLIRQARVLNGASPYHLSFDQSQTERDFLGYMVPNHEIRRAGYLALKDCRNIDILDNAEVVAASSDAEAAYVSLSDGRQLAARLLVAADSRFSETRRMFGVPARSRDFARTCIVCRMSHEIPHEEIAYECFHYARTLAILPLPGNQSSIVITLPSGETEAVMALDDAAFATDIMRRFEGRLGQMQLSGPRHAYPLVGVYADRFFANRFALVGDAAVGMHPVTAHGYNLGLSGAQTLAQEISAALAKGQDFAARRVLLRYNRRHNKRSRPLYLGTNGLVGLFTDERLPARLLRGAFLRLGNHLPPARRMILSQLTDIPRSMRQV